MLIMVISIFAIEFFIHYAFDAHWAITQFGVFKNITITISGVVVGISIGRSITYLSKYHRAKSIDLSKHSL